MEHAEAAFVSRATLAARWELSERTLALWEKAGKGPRPVRFGRTIRYRLADVTAYEAEALASSA